MQAVLREGRSEARVAPLDVVQPGSIGVGALAGLAGEITVIDGRVLVSEKSFEPGSRETSSSIRVRDGSAHDRAALLLLAQVKQWEQYELGAISDYAALDAAIERQLNELGRDLREPTPVRVRGKSGSLELHVIAGACPIANPSGPAPGRHTAAFDSVEIVGFFAQGAAGRWTHHTHSSHLHAVVEDAMGHLNEVALEAGAVLLLPCVASSAVRPGPQGE